MEGGTYLREGFLVKNHGKWGVLRGDPVAGGGWIVSLTNI